jgi:pathogenicity locus Cdd1 protein
MRITTEDMSKTRATTIRDLRRIPGVGPSIAQDLLDLGVRSVADLEDADPEALYQRLCALRGAHQDRCLLYVFRCAVYFAGPGPHDPERLRWWVWKDAPSAMAARRA